MTIETGQYAELSDIRGLRFECKNCKAVIVLPLSQIIGGIPYNCVNCKSTWSAMASRDVSSAIEMLTGALRQFQYFNESPTTGFSFSLELTREAEPTTSASRVSSGKD